MGTRLRLFPLNAVLFPGATLNLHVFEPRYKQMIGECIEHGEPFGVVLIREGREAGDASVKPYHVGSIAKIVEVAELPFGRYYLSTVGSSRFKIARIAAREPFLVADVELLAEPSGSPGELRDLQQRVHDLFGDYASLIARIGVQCTEVDLSSDVHRNAFLVADALQIPDALKQGLLEAESTQARLLLELRYLRRLLPQLRELVERRQAELEARRARGELADPHRDEQEKFFGKYFSAN